MAIIPGTIYPLKEIFYEPGVDDAREVFKELVDEVNHLGGRAVEYHNYVSLVNTDVRDLQADISFLQVEVNTLKEITDTQSKLIAGIHLELETLKKEIKELQDGSKNKL